ncbi:hypothetical protein [Rhizorhabdus argentea]|uniref:hypothetical protein n=1 Tax=Rhizorhabdus argentea TaxID=1387174 RepID=UPI0030ED160D
MADFAPMEINAETIGPDGLAAALTVAVHARHPVLLRWPGAQVSPLAAGFMKAALAASASDTRIAGISLGLPRLRPSTRVPFVPIEDGYDTILLQLLQPSAIMFTPIQAERAVYGMARNGGDLSAYLTRADCYLLAPRTSLAHDGLGDSAQQRLFPVAPREWRVGRVSKSLAIYDARLEIAPEAARRLSDALEDRIFAVDLWGNRPADQIGDGLLLSARPCRQPILTFPLEFTPLEANLSAPADEGFFSLGAAGDFGAMDAPRRERLFRHVTRYNALDGYIGQFFVPVRQLIMRERR